MIKKFNNYVLLCLIATLSAFACAGSPKNSVKNDCCCISWFCGGNDDTIPQPPQQQQPQQQQYQVQENCDMCGVVVGHDENNICSRCEYGESQIKSNNLKGIHKNFTVRFVDNNKEIYPLELSNFPNLVISDLQNDIEINKLIKKYKFKCIAINQSNLLDNDECTNVIEILIEEIENRLKNKIINNKNEIIIECIKIEDYEDGKDDKKEIKYNNVLNNKNKNNNYNYNNNNNNNNQQQINNNYNNNQPQPQQQINNNQQPQQPEPQQQKTNNIRENVKVEFKDKNKNLIGEIKIKKVSLDNESDLCSVLTLNIKYPPRLEGYLCSLDNTYKTIDEYKCKQALAKEIILQLKSSGILGDNTVTIQCTNDEDEKYNGNIVNNYQPQQIDNSENKKVLEKILEKINVIKKEYGIPCNIEELDRLINHLVKNGNQNKNELLRNLEKEATWLLEILKRYETQIKSLKKEQKENDEGFWEKDLKRNFATEHLKLNLCKNSARNVKRRDFKSIELKYANELSTDEKYETHEKFPDYKGDFYDLIKKHLEKRIPDGELQASLFYSDKNDKNLNEKSDNHINQRLGDVLVTLSSLNNIKKTGRDSFNLGKERTLHKKDYQFSVYNRFLGQMNKIDKDVISELNMICFALYKLFKELGKDVNNDIYMDYIIMAVCHAARHCRSCTQKALRSTLEDFCPKAKKCKNYWRIFKQLTTLKEEDLNPIDNNIPNFDYLANVSYTIFKERIFEDFIKSKIPKDKDLASSVMQTWERYCNDVGVPKNDNYDDPSKLVVDIKTDEFTRKLKTTESMEMFCAKIDLFSGSSGANRSNFPAMALKNTLPTISNLLVPNVLKKLSLAIFCKNGIIKSN